MAYGHAERNLTLIRQLEAETRKLLGSLNQLDPEQSAWLHGVTGGRGGQRVADDADPGLCRGHWVSTSHRPPRRRMVPGS